MRGGRTVLRNGRVLSMERKRSFIGVIFVSPFILGTLIFFAYPLIFSIFMSFCRFDSGASLSNLTFHGFNHYLHAFAIDVEFVPKFLEVLRNTMINSPLIVVFSLILAICLNKKFVGRSVFRTIMILPFLLGSGLIFRYLLYSGATEDALKLTRGIRMPSGFITYLGENISSIISLFLDHITLVFWKSGLQILLFLSGLQSVSPSLYESARCDSATEWEMLWYITIPMMSPIIVVNFMYTIIDSFTDSNNSMMRYFNLQAFGYIKFDYASAISWIYFSVVFLILGLAFLFMRRFSGMNDSVAKGKRG